jgi:hypothetical protein
MDFLASLARHADLRRKKISAPQWFRRKFQIHIYVFPVSSKQESIGAI